IGRFDSLIHTPRTGGPRGTYNAAYNNLAPPLPRDVGYTLLLSFVLLLLLGSAQRSPALLVAAGVSLGLVGLTSAEFFFVGLGVAVLTVAFASAVPRPVAAAALFLPALLLYAIWVVPLIVSYVRLGGFVNTTGVGPIVLGPAEILMSWGLVTPFGVYAAVRWLPRRWPDLDARILAGLVVAAGVLVAASSLIPRLLGPGFQILGRTSRYWPVLQLAAALLAGIGAAELIATIASWRVGAAVGAAAVTIALALPVPLNATLAVSRSAGESVLGASILGTRTTYLSTISGRGRRRCVVAAPPELALQIFSYTGYREVAYRGLTRHLGNFSRIRWRDIYRRIPSDDERLMDDAVLIGGTSPLNDWQRLVQKYAVSVVVTTAERAMEIRRLVGLPPSSSGIEPALVAIPAGPCSEAS
ncbi:MAG TPA: hypothetical protein VF660_07980, partial [Actinomycetota bacterium]